MLYACNINFYNIVHLSAVVPHVTCTFLDCFSTHLQLERVISVFILIFSHIICLCMFLIYSGCSDMVWADGLSSPMGRNFIDIVRKSFLQYVHFCMPPKIFFQHHSCCRNCQPYHIYIFLSFFH